jgi:hypothetical protein
MGFRFAVRRAEAFSVFVPILLKGRKEQRRLEADYEICQKFFWEIGVFHENFRKHP